MATVRRPKIRLIKLKLDAVIGGAAFILTSKTKLLPYMKKKVFICEVWQIKMFQAESNFNTAALISRSRDWNLCRSALQCETLSLCFFKSVGENEEGMWGRRQQNTDARISPCPQTPVSGPLIKSDVCVGGRKLAGASLKALKVRAFSAGTGGIFTVWADKAQISHRAVRNKYAFLDMTRGHDEEMTET